MADNVYEKIFPCVQEPSGQEVRYANIRVLERGFFFSSLNHTPYRSRSDHVRSRLMTL
jgi:hypothetical protein